MFKTMKASEIDEIIGRGEPCPCCGMPWVTDQTHISLYHLFDCPWPKRPFEIDGKTEFPVIDKENREGIRNP